MNIFDKLAKHGIDTLPTLVELKKDPYCGLSDEIKSLLAPVEDDPEVAAFIENAENDQYYLAELISKPSIQRQIKEYTTLTKQDISQALDEMDSLGVNVLEMIVSWLKTGQPSEEVITKLRACESSKAITKLVRFIDNGQISADSVNTVFMPDKEIITALTELEKLDVDVLSLLHKWQKSGRIGKRTLTPLQPLINQPALTKFIKMASLDPAFYSDIVNAKGFAAWQKRLDDKYVITDDEIEQSMNLIESMGVDLVPLLAKWVKNYKIDKPSLKLIKDIKGEPLVDKFLSFAERDPMFIADIQGSVGFEKWEPLIEQYEKEKADAQRLKLEEKRQAAERLKAKRDAERLAERQLQAEKAEQQRQQRAAEERAIQKAIEQAEQQKAREEALRLEEEQKKAEAEEALKQQQALKRSQKLEEMRNERSHPWLVATIVISVLTCLGGLILAANGGIILTVIIAPFGIWIAGYCFNKYKKPHGDPCPSCGEFYSISRVATNLLEQNVVTRERFQHRISDGETKMREVSVTQNVYRDTYECDNCQYTTFSRRTVEVD